MLVGVSYAFGQSIIISGFVLDAESQEKLVNATIYDQNSGKGTVSNSYGFFSFQSESHIDLVISYVGYKELDIKVYNDTTLTIALESDNMIDEVSVTHKRDQFHESSPGKISISSKEIEKLPTFLGEKDVIKSLQLMPGIEMGEEGNSGMYVRGGDRGQNLILLDGVTVYNVNHLFGFFSVFTPEAINSIDVYKGGFPARYSGRLSSVMDISMKEGNMKKYKTDLTIGTISSKILVEGPIVKGKSSFLFAGRRTYADVFLSPFLTTKYKIDNRFITSKVGYHFYDANAKLNFQVSSKDRIYLSLYSGKDKLRLHSKEEPFAESASSSMRSVEETNFDNSWGNITAALRWNRLITPSIFANTTLYFSDYRYLVDQQSNGVGINPPDTISYFMATTNASGIRDFGVKMDLDILSFSNHHIKTGFSSVFHQFNPVDVYNSYSQSDVVLQEEDYGSSLGAFEGNLYCEDQIKIGDKLVVNTGINSMLYLTKEQNYLSVQPRFSLRYQYTPVASFKGAYSRMAQPTHLLVNSSDVLLVDLWMPSTGVIKPAVSDIIEFGWYREIKSMYKLSFEAYYKKMDNLIHYHNGESFITLEGEWTEKVTTGTGESYGLESLIAKNTGNTTGWFSYTLSWNNRQFSTLNNGQSFPFKYDSRHRFKLAIMHNINKSIDASFSWVYFSGSPITLSSSYYRGDVLYIGEGFQNLLTGMFSDQAETLRPERIQYYSSINNYRLPDYHRMDVGISFSKQKKRGKRIWNISIYNLYGRNNPSVISKHITSEGEVVYKSFVMFRFVPSISYRFIFNG